MNTSSHRFAFCGMILCLSLCWLTACKNDTRSNQQPGTLSDPSATDVTRLAVGGDSRDDIKGVVPWAFKEAARRGAKAFFFLGDLELTPGEDSLFVRKLPDLGNVLFYPAIGNHEVKTFGVVSVSPEESRERVKKFKEKFVKARGVNPANIPDAAAYSADLEGNVHLIALDNVSRKGFGDDQLKWLATDLAAARAAGKIILVGMHKGLARNPITTHAMDEDGPDACKDSDAALALFKKHKVAMVFVSHSHRYAAYNQDGLEVRLTGGLGAPVVKGLSPEDGGFYHFLLVDVPLSGSISSLKVEVVKFQGAPITEPEEKPSACPPTP